MPDVTHDPVNTRLARLALLKAAIELVQMAPPNDPATARAVHALYEAADTIVGLAEQPLTQALVHEAIVKDPLMYAAFSVGIEEGRRRAEADRA